MRILIVTRICTGHGLSGGMEMATQQFAEMLKDAGHDVSILTTHGADRAVTKDTYVNHWETSGGRPGKYSLSWWFQTARHSAIHTWKPSLIVSVSHSAASMIIWSKVPTLAVCHGTAISEIKSSARTGGLREFSKILLNSMRIPREIFAYNNFDKVVAVSDEVERQLVSNPYRLSKTRLATVPNGVDQSRLSFDANRRAEFRRRFQIAPDTSVGITLSRLHAQKGIDIAIRTLLEPGPGRNRALIVAGTGPQEKELRELAEQLGVAESVHFVGHLNHNEVVDALCGADLLVFPTRRKEGLPLSLLESLATGLPVVTTDACNVPTDLSGMVIKTSGSAKSTAMSWPAVPHSDDVRSTSRLPARYYSSTANTDYLDLVDLIAASQV